MDIEALSAQLQSKLKQSQPLESVLKRFYTNVQPTIDLLATQLHEYLKDDIEEALLFNEGYMRVTGVEITESNRLFCAVLIPTLTMVASDIAPTYDLQVLNIWYLCMYGKIGFAAFSGFQGKLYSMFSNQALDDKLNLLRNEYGIRVVLDTPTGLRYTLVTDLLQRHRMVERFTTVPTILPIIPE